MDRFVHMPTTIWTQIADVRRHRTEAIDQVFRKYQPAILAFIRAAGHSPEEAADLAQEVFLTLVQDRVLFKADRARGRFRSLLLAITRHTMSNHRRHQNRRKREGSRKVRPLDAAEVEMAVAEGGDDPDFDMLWVQNLVGLSLERLRAEYEEAGRFHFRALELFTKEGLGYPEIADRLKRSVADVKNLIFQARAKLRERLLSEIQAYSASTQEYEDEVNYLAKFLA